MEEKSFSDLDPLEREVKIQAFKDLLGHGSLFKEGLLREASGFYSQKPEPNFRAEWDFAAEIPAKVDLKCHWVLYQKGKTDSPSRNHLGYFPQLCFDSLEAWARGWAIQFPFIGKISLFRAPVKHKRWFGTYIVFFQVSDSISETGPDKKIAESIKIRPSQEDKSKVQEIGRKIWAEHEVLDIIHVERHPEILKIVGRQYKGKRTVRNWLSEIAPDRAKQRGRRPMDIREKQEKICKELDIIPKK